MSIQEILLACGGGTVGLLILIQVSPLKINPWTAIGKLFRKMFEALGKIFNAAVLAELLEVKAAQEQTQKRLDEHIKTDAESKVDERRANILRFNNELLRDIPHTKEEFHEVLADIDAYEAYCRDHEDYKNGRAVHAIANIGRVYDERLVKHDFLK